MKPTKLRFTRPPRGFHQTIMIMFQTQASSGKKGKENHRPGIQHQEREKVQANKHAEQATWVLSGEWHTFKISSHHHRTPQLVQQFCFSSPEMTFRPAQHFLSYHSYRVQLMPCVCVCLLRSTKLTCWSARVGIKFSPTGYTFVQVPATTTIRDCDL